MRQKTQFVFAIVLALVLGSVSRIEAQLTRGTLSGAVLDSTGARVPAVSVTIVSQATGAIRRVWSSEDGFYRVTGLEPGEYTLTFERDGFTVIEERDVPVRSAGETTRPVTLTPAGVVETVQVTAGAGAAAVNKATPTVGLMLSGDQAATLPVSTNRDVTRLALLAPTMVRATGASAFSASGQRSRNNNFTVDGSDNNEMTISTFTMAVPPEAVAEIRVQTNAYDVEAGRNSGAQINVITRSGTNQLRGDAHEYYRGSALDALSNVQKDSGLSAPPRFNQHVFGASAGGALVRDRAFFYGLAEADRSRSASTLGATVRIPTPAGYEALASVPLGPGQSPASRQAVLSRLDFLRDVYATAPTFRNVQPAVVNGSPIDTGQVNLGRSTPGNALNLTGRMDVQWSPVDRSTVRAARHALVNDSVYSNVDFGSRFAADEDVLDRHLAFSHVRVFTASALNEFRVSHIRRRLDFPEHDAASPTATIGGFFTVGGRRDFPQARLQDSVQLSNVLTVQGSRHGLKIGADLRYISLDNLAAFDSKGTFTFNTLQDFLNNRAVLYRQAVQTASFDASQWQAFFFVQDDWRVTPATTVNLGLRYETASVPLGFFGATDPAVREALVPGPLRADRNNLAPRVGLTWSPSVDSGVGKWLFADA
ncbi:MAG: TonB-dependent receptor, partial [Vicinamibacterales bacterium]